MAREHHPSNYDPDRLDALHAAVAAAGAASADLIGAAVAYRFLLLEPHPEGTIRQLVAAEDTFVEAVDRYLATIARVSPRGAAVAGWRGPGVYDVAALDPTGAIAGSTAAETVGDLADTVEGFCPPGGPFPEITITWTGPIPGASR